VCVCVCAVGCACTQTWKKRWFTLEDGDVPFLSYYPNEKVRVGVPLLCVCVCVCVCWVRLCAFSFLVLPD
jgi:hypothetical protein